MNKRFLTALTALVLGLAFSATTLSAATINVPGDQPDIATAVGVAAPGDLILVAPGTYVIGATINVNTANLTIQGNGIANTTLQVASTVGNMFAIGGGGSGTTIRDFKIEKTDIPGAPHNLISINANNVTVRDNEIFGPDPGIPWSPSGPVSRAMVVSPGLTGLLIQGNYIHHLRQPAYIDGPPGVNRGSILNNHVSRTRGWVLDGALLTITGNTWGPPGPENEGAEIALINTSTPVDYPNLLALSNANSNAYISAQWVGGENGRATAYVDDSAAPGGFGSASAPYQSVQTGVNNTLTGGTVSVAAGSYTEQVVVGKNMTIQGAGKATTFILSPTTLATSFATPGNSNFAVVLAQNAADIRVRDLTVDGNGKGNTNYRFVGVAFYNAGGKLLDCDVVRVRNTPWDGTQHGNGVYSYNNTSGPYALEVGGCTVSDFNKGGITLNGAGLTANVHDCTVTGNGATTITAQNGIQVGTSVAAALTNNAVSNIGYLGTNYVSCGILAFGPGPVTVTGGSVTNCQFGLYAYDANGSMTGTAIATSFAAGGPLASSYYPAYGVGVYNSSASAPNFSARAEGGPVAARPQASPFDGEDLGAFARTGPMATAAAMSFTISGGCFTGADLTGSEGIEVWSAGGPLTVTATGLEVTNWDYGMVVDGAGVAMNANHNALFSNVSAGYYGFAGPSHLAAFNWWGHSSGPSGAGPGSGDAVVGATVTFAPWLISGADSNPGCGFATGPDNVIAVGPAPSCITPANPCLTIPVTIARTTSDNMRGFSVTLQLSSNLTLCTSPPATAILEGTYLSAISGTTFQVVDNGGGNYTVDGAILGMPCGATAASGTLFTLNVMKAPGPDGTGTITIGTVLTRDCVNAPIATTAGAPLNITIDTAAPTAIANLAASQVKLGNDGDGTTKITLAFTAPGDAAVVEVYRAPYGQYPEYDDLGGAPPAAPSYPPAGPWALTGVTATGQTDETTVRDFWYFVAFTKDACGNVSGVSNMTSGTLNYHLGDVSNGITPGQGNNLVNTADISLLGSNYGITITSPHAVNYLDVGPTTDYYVNARPTTDNKINFEDLMMFAINYGTVSVPQDAPALVAAGANEIGIGEVPAAAVGETFVVPVRMAGAGNVLGASLAFAYDAKVVEFVSAEAGGLLQSQGREGVVLSPSAGVVDFALLGEGAGVQGEGALVNVTFRRVGAGEAAIALKGVTARDAANRPVNLAGATPVAPTVTMMSSPFPNPFRGSTSLRLALAREGQAKVAVYDLVGRRVRTLVTGLQPAGERMLVWDGRDDGGREVPAGLYLVRFTGDGVEQSRRIILTQ